MVQKNARPRGRPRSFDERRLEKATRVFWAKGYDGATIDDLVAGMGVGRPSLYAVFGDKRTLFLRPQGLCGEERRLAAKALLSPRTLRESPSASSGTPSKATTEKGCALGCLLVCVAPLVDDAEVRQFLQYAAAGGAAMVEGRFRDGITAGEIPSDFPVAVREASSPILLVALPCVADRHAAQDAPQGCRGGGRLVAPAASGGYRQAEAMTSSRHPASKSHFANSVAPVGSYRSGGEGNGGTQEQLFGVVDMAMESWPVRSRKRR